MSDHRRYQATLRALKKQGLTHRQAQTAWRVLRDRLDRSPRATDLRKHPRITRQVVKAAPVKERAQRAARTREKRRQEKAKGKPEVGTMVGQTISLPTIPDSPTRRRGQNGRR